MDDGLTKELTITKVFNVPVGDVFKAWTDPEVIAKWWGPNGVTNPECQVDFKVGGKIRIVMLAGEELGPLAGQRWPMEGQFTEIDDGKKLVFKNNAVDDNGNILIDALTTVTFEEVDGKTKLTVQTTAKGLTEQSAQMLAGMNDGWNQSIDKLEKLLQ